jgi:hypothetical protein
LFIASLLNFYSFQNSVVEAEPISSENDDKAPDLNSDASSPAEKLEYADELEYADAVSPLSLDHVFDIFVNFFFIKIH